MVKGHKYDMSMGEIYSEVASQSWGSTKEADGEATDEASGRKRLPNPGAPIAICITASEVPQPIWSCTPDVKKQMRQQMTVYAARVCEPANIPPITH